MDIPKKNYQKLKTNMLVIDSLENYCSQTPLQIKDMDYGISDTFYGRSAMKIPSIMRRETYTDQNTHQNF